MRRTLLPAIVAAALLGAGCGDDDDESRVGDAAPSPPVATGGADSSAQRFPDIREAELLPQGRGTFSLDVTVSSPYDTPQRYADGWRVLAAGTQRVLGTHMLTHDHASEQPFTRSQPELRIPAGVERITVEGRDQRNGYGGRTVTVPVPTAGS